MEDLSRFVSEDCDIIERLYKKTRIELKSYDDFLNLPVNEEYKKNQEKRNKIGIEESKKQIEESKIE